MICQRVKQGYSYILLQLSSGKYSWSTRVDHRRWAGSSALYACVRIVGMDTLKTLSTTKPNKKTKIHVLVAVPYHSQHALVEFPTYTAGWSPKIIGYSLIMISSKTTCFFPNCLELPSAGPPPLFALLRCPFFGLVSDISAS